MVTLGMTLYTCVMGHGNDHEFRVVEAFDQKTVYALLRLVRLTFLFKAQESYSVSAIDASPTTRIAISFTLLYHEVVQLKRRHRL